MQGISIEGPNQIPSLLCSSLGGVFAPHGLTERAGRDDGWSAFFFLCFLSRIGRLKKVSTRQSIVLCVFARFRYHRFSLFKRKDRE